MNLAEHNYQLLRDIEANADSLLQATAQNPHRLARAEPRLRWMLGLESGLAAAAKLGLSSVQSIGGATTGKGNQE